MSNPVETPWQSWEEREKEWDNRVQAETGEGPSGLESVDQDYRGAGGVARRKHQGRAAQLGLCDASCQKALPGPWSSGRTRA